MFDRPPRIAEWVAALARAWEGWGRHCRRFERDLGPARRRTHLVLGAGADLFPRVPVPYRRVIPDFHRDLHYATRVIRRNPGYAITPNNFVASYRYDLPLRSSSVTPTRRPKGGPSPESRVSAAVFR